MNLQSELKLLGGDKVVPLNKNTYWKDKNNSIKYMYFKYIDPYLYLYDKC